MPAGRWIEFGGRRRAGTPQGCRRHPSDEPWMARSEEFSMSRVGKSPIPVPSGVDVTLGSGRISVKGPQGTLERALPEPITIRQEDSTLLVERPNDERQNRALHG